MKTVYSCDGVSITAHPDLNLGMTLFHAVQGTGAVKIQYGFSAWGTKFQIEFREGTLIVVEEHQTKRSGKCESCGAAIGERHIGSQFAKVVPENCIKVCEFCGQRNGQEHLLTCPYVAAPGVKK